MRDSVLEDALLLSSSEHVSHVLAGLRCLIVSNV
jgi:hypothetical protein